MAAPVTPTTREVAENIVDQVSIALGQAASFLPKSFIAVFAKALAGVVVVLYKYAGFIFLQAFVRTASDQLTTINGRQVVPLYEWGRLVGIGEPIGATQAEHEIDVTVLEQGGYLVSGTQLVHTPTGVTYTVTGDVPLTDSTVNALVTAVGDQQGGDGSGAIGTRQDGDELQFANPQGNIARTAIVTNTVTVGADAETTEGYRQRIYDRFSKRPQGGAYADYEIWGEEVPGIANVYPYTSEECNGQVKLYVESATEEDGIPTESQLQAVLDSVNFDNAGLASRRPANALPNTYPITRTAVDTRVLGLEVPGDISTVKDQIEEALTEYYLSREPYILGLSVGARVDRIKSSQVGSVVEGIVSAAGGTFDAVVLYVEGIATATYTLGEGEKSKLGDLTYV